MPQPRHSSPQVLRVHERTSPTGASECGRVVDMDVARLADGLGSCRARPSPAYLREPRFRMSAARRSRDSRPARRLLLRRLRPRATRWGAFDGNGKYLLQAERARHQRRGGSTGEETPAEAAASAHRRGIGADPCGFAAFPFDAPRLPRPGEESAQASGLPGNHFPTETRTHGVLSRAPIWCFGADPWFLSDGSDGARTGLGGIGRGQQRLRRGSGAKPAHPVPARVCRGILYHVCLIFGALRLCWRVQAPKPHPPQTDRFAQVLASVWRRKTVSSRSKA